MKKFVMFPLEEYKQTGNVRKGLRKGTSNLAGTVAYESLTLGAKITDFAAKKLSKTQTRAEFDSHSSRSTPLPRNMGDASGQAIESLSRGLKEANAKVIIMPYREYQKTGTRGAVKSVVKGIPVAVCANLQGAAEAVSYGLYGFRNQLRPDLREEEEASARLHNDF
jgi:autophagy-related protein 2